MSTSYVTYHQDGPLAYLTFNRPEARNAMTWDMYDAVADHCAAFAADDSAKVLILSGAGGKAFVAGSDIAQFRDFSTPEDGLNYERRLDAVLTAIETLPKPTIAAIDGFATGGGVALAVACDVRLCTTRSRFGVPIARTLGNCLSASNIARFLDLIGPARLKDLLFTGRLLAADEALAAGLVNRVVDDAELDEVTRQTALTIASNAPLTIYATKEMIRRIQRERHALAVDTSDLIVRCYTSADFKEGVDSFLAKRPARWTGA